MIEVNDLIIKYEDQLVIDNISFSIQKNAITTIIGPNGCGKSTIFKAISKTKKIQAGTISYNSIDIRKMKKKSYAKKIAILPQSPSVPSDLTVRELVEYGRYPHLGWTNKLRKKDIEIVDWAVEITDIKRLEHRKIHTMSGGERQRAWIAMAITQQPELLLLDEPTTYLDVCYQFEVLELIKRINKEMNITVVMILHDLNQAARYSDRVIIMNSGKVYKSGVPRQIINQKALNEVFKLNVKIINDKEDDSLYFVPLSSCT
ncbi:ABC transporter ATP-binding protein [Clostridiaceae bacterium M8S5]|nr:ABC transporter ATP-binding protein [Clostridiaceae bacterium M8S5]